MWPISQLSVHTLMLGVDDLVAYISMQFTIQNYLDFFEDGLNLTPFNSLPL